MCQHQTLVELVASVACCHLMPAVSACGDSMLILLHCMCAIACCFMRMHLAQGGQRV